MLMGAYFRITYCEKKLIQDNSILIKFNLVIMRVMHKASAVKPFLSLIFRLPFSQHMNNNLIIYIHETRGVDSIHFRKKDTVKFRLNMTIFIHSHISIV